MSQTAIVVQGVVKADGTLDIVIPLRAKEDR